MPLITMIAGEPNLDLEISQMELFNFLLSD